MMLRSARSFVPLFVTLLAAGLAAAACSGSSAEDTSLASTGGSSATGGSTYRVGPTGSAGKGGSSTGSSSTGGSSTGGSNTGGSNTGGTGVGSSSSGGSANATSSGGSSAISTDACPGVSIDHADQGGSGADTCAGVSNEAEPIPVDLFVMMDRSVSMGNLVPGTSMTRWEALQQAVQEFAQSSTGDDIRAGIGFFGLSNSGDTDIDCDSTKYAQAVVEIGALATTGPALVAAMADMLPGGLTPSGPALTGALDYAAGWAKNNAGRATAVVLVSDGYPTECQPLSITDLSTIAKNAHLNAPYVRTYVIGLGGDVNLDAIALAGGTHRAFTVDEGNIGSTFVAALHNVADTKLACEYALPPSTDAGQKLDLSKVSVTYTPPGDVTTEEVPSIAGLGACANSPNGGWYYDNPTNPSSIEVCPCTCSRFEAGRVDIRVGCKPLVGPR